MGEENYKDKFIKMPACEIKDKQQIQTQIQTPTKVETPERTPANGYSEIELKKLQEDANKIKNTILESVIKE